MTRHLPSAEVFTANSSSFILLHFLTLQPKEFLTPSLPALSESKPWNPVHTRLLLRSTHNLHLASTPVTGSSPWRYCLHYGQCASSVMSPNITSTSHSPSLSACCCIHEFVNSQHGQNPLEPTRLVTVSQLSPTNPSSFPLLPFHPSTFTLLPSLSAKPTVSMQAFPRASAPTSPSSHAQALAEIFLYVITLWATDFTVPNRKVLAYVIRMAHDSKSS